MSWHNEFRTRSAGFSMTSPSGGQLALKATVYGLALTALCVAFALMHVVVRPFQRKFFCDDQSIRYPTGQCTVPYYVCAPVGVLTAWLTVAAAEWGQARAAAAHRSKGPRHLRSLMAFARRAFSDEFKARYFSQVLYGVYYFCLGLAACDFLMGMAKNVFGRHRPHFYAVCRPEFPGGGCNSSVAYDVAAVCRPAVTDREFLDAQRSFPSGHASFGIYCAAFVVLYLRGRGASLATVPRLAAQFAVTAGGLFVAYSRVPDYKHHWSDVLAGGILGACMAWAAAGAVPPSSAGVQDGRDYGDNDEPGEGGRAEVA